MSPNLYLAVTNLVQPWKLFKRPDVARNNARKMHFSNEPVPGIYAFTAKNKQYLVAIRPNGKKDTEHIFQEPKTNTRRMEALKSVTTFTSMSVNALPPGSPFELSLNQSKSQSRYGSEYATTKTEDTTTVTEIYGSCTSLETATTKRSTEKGNSDTGLTGRIPGPSSSISLNTGIDSKQTTTSSTTYRSTKSCICPPGKVIHSVDYILKNDGHLPHQQSPWSQQNLKRNARSRSFLKFKSKDEPRGLEQIDIIGYRFLAKPLEVEFNRALKRWMFCSEVKERSVVSLMCADLCCMEKDPKICGKPVWRKLFALDDGESYVVVAGHLSWKRFKKDGSEILYCVDKESEMIRRQTVKEVELSRRNLEKAKPRFLVSDDAANDMPVVRYLEGK
jgi:hypothetical protein